MHIEHYIKWRDHHLQRDGQPLMSVAHDTPLTDIPLQVYEQAAVNYPKFYKMDLLGRVAFLAAELLPAGAEDADKEKVAVALSTGSGCLDVDKKYNASRETLASPALFVYTLPNIMLGEICIRHGFKGEQMTTVAAQPDIDWMLFYVNDLLTCRHTEACLLGHVEATEQGIDATLLWVSNKPNNRPIAGFDRNALQSLFY